MTGVVGETISCAGEEVLSTNAEKSTLQVRWRNGTNIVSQNESYTIDQKAIDSKATLICEVKQLGDLGPVFRLLFLSAAIAFISLLWIRIRKISDI